MASVLYVVGDCSSCETGPLGVRICGGCGTPYLLCDECDALWDGIDLSQPPRFVAQPDLPCPSCGQSLGRKPGHWASFAEIEAAGWQTSIRDVTRPFGDGNGSDEDC